MSNQKLEDFILIISISDQLNSQSFLEDLFKLKNQVLENKLENTDSLNCYPFKLDNKYYEADIKFVTLRDQSKLEPNLIDQVEVLAILFDIEQKNYLGKIEQIYSKFNDDNLQEKILICKSPNNDVLEMNSDQLMNWCCKNKFELVDLGEFKDNEDDDELIPESVGLNRFIEILDTHSWSSIQFKDEQKNNNLNTKKITSDLRSEIKQDNLMDNYFKELSLNDNVEGSTNLEEKKLTFEELFSQIREFKEKADQLTGDDRYNYAEKVAMAFLNSLDEDD